MKKHYNILYLKLNAVMLRLCFDESIDCHSFINHRFFINDYLHIKTLSMDVLFVCGIGLGRGFYARNRSTRTEGNVSTGINTDE